MCWGHVQLVPEQVVQALDIWKSVNLSPSLIPVSFGDLLSAVP